MIENRRQFLSSLIGCIIFAANLTFAQDTTPVDPNSYDQKVIVACVGDSITRGVGAKGNSYPKQLQEMLGDAWLVKNFGHSGATLMNSGNKPYQKTRDYKDAIASNADVVVIMLGTNDTKPNNWKNFENDFDKDYRDLIEDFATQEKKPRIFLCTPPYIAGDGNWGINEPSTLKQIPVVNKIAKELKLGVADVHSELDGNDELIPDKVHPNVDGAKLIAKAVYKALTGKTYQDTE